MNKQPYAIPPRWWEPKLSPSIVRLTRSYRAWKLRKQQKITSIDVSGQEHLQSALNAGHGVLIAPNHAAHYDSAALYIAADRLKTPLYYMTAWQVFGMASRYEQVLMQRLGCFSIDRESADRKAFKQAVHVLQNETSPLVIFPEGDIYHITDRVTPFREGAAAVAISAARRSDRKIVVVPCGIKFWYVDDPTAKLHRTMNRLDERLFLRPEKDQTLKLRIQRFAEAILALKEIEYLGASQAGLLVDRIECLAESILRSMSNRYETKVSNKPIPDRVKDLRQKIISQLDEVKQKKPKTPTPEFLVLSRDMDDLFLVMQLYSYPGDYLSGTPSVERLAETIDKFEEDVLDKEIPSLRGRRRVEIRFGESIFVPAKSTGRDGVGALTREMQSSVQGLIDELSLNDTSLPAKVDVEPGPSTDAATSA